MIEPGILDHTGRRANGGVDPAQGRGWAVVKGDELHGKLFFHGGDDSEFVAKKKKSER